MALSGLQQYHHEKMEWSDDLLFYKDELKIWKKRLSEVVTANTAAEILSMVEHFENQFIIQNENIDIFDHEIDEFEKKLAKEEMLASKIINVELLMLENKLREKVKSFEHNIIELKHEFKQFIRKTL